MTTVRKLKDQPLITTRCFSPLVTHLRCTPPFLIWEYVVATVFPFSFSGPLVKNAPICGWPGHGLIQKLKRFQKLFLKSGIETLSFNITQKHQLIAKITSINSTEQSGDMLVSHKLQKYTFEGTSFFLWLLRRWQKCKTKWPNEGNINWSIHTQKQKNRAATLSRKSQIGSPSPHNKNHF